MYQWRGGEGSITDRPMEDQCRPMPLEGKDCEPIECGVHDFAADTRPSTGMVYMRARYYDPAVGRFTQADPVPYGPEMMWGQNNRWTYCANDPLNQSDPSGQIWFLALVGFILGFGFGLAYGLSAAPPGIGFLGVLKDLIKALTSTVCVTYGAVNTLGAFLAALTTIGESTGLLSQLALFLGAGVAPVGGAALAALTFAIPLVIGFMIGLAVSRL